MELLKKAQENLSKGDSTSKDLVEEAERAKKELEEVLKSANLEIVGVTKRKLANPSRPHYRRHQRLACSSSGRYWPPSRQVSGAQTHQLLPSPLAFGKSFCVINEFNNWQKQPNLAEAVAAIRALATVIRASEANTMMELEIELKKAFDSLKVKFLCLSFLASCSICYLGILRLCSKKLLE
ncbi:hypothetical protein SO802_016289 [Lithocarpus litseifolius]|uniref:Uncharacterized protein n=1 Tax=Lithocarpus litseifolius TaxID=425828 RepID=A0AAW2CW30_9ROSI